MKTEARCAERNEVVRWLDETLAISQGGDYPGAWNGLQVEGTHRVSRITAAVDASPSVIRKAISLKADLLVVHHGLFWHDIRPLTGQRRRLFGEMFLAGLSVYSSHLPLDRHPVHGNNILLAKELGLADGTPFFEEFGAAIGLRFDVKIALDQLKERIALATGSAPKTFAFGPQTTRSIGIVTGGGGSGLHRAVAEGVDTFVTGEGPHWTFAAAEEIGINLIYAGHYATETFGVRSLAEALGGHFGLPWQFIDLPSGL